MTTTSKNRGEEALDGLPANIRKLTTFVPESECWEHRSGPYGQTRTPTGVRRVAYVVLEAILPDISGGILAHEHDTGAAGLSIRSGEDCTTDRCINPLHLSIMDRSERAAIANRERVLVSKYLGVIWHGATDRWTCRLAVDGTTHYGRYHVAEEAAAANYDELVTEFAEGRPTNFSMGLLSSAPGGKGA